MCAYDFVVGLGKYQVADLGAGVDAIQRSQIQSVPESDALISGAATCCEQASVKWGPVDGLHGCLMI